MGLFKSKSNTTETASPSLTNGTAKAPETPDYAKLPFKELVALHKVIDGEIKARQTNGVAEVRTQVLTICEQYGVAIKDLIKKPRAASTKTIKYVDPENSENTWSGRGRQPSWLAEKIESGASVEEFAVK